MERQIGERGRYPALNILRSVSRIMPRAADQAFLPVLPMPRQVMATYADMEELIRLGAYQGGSSPEVDEAIALHGPLEESSARRRTNPPVLGTDSALRKFCASRKPKNNIVLSSSWIAWTAVVAGYGNKRNRARPRQGLRGSMSR